MNSVPPAPVVVILGAGASLASGDYSGDVAPPLTADLFEHPRAQELIHSYPLAQMAGRLITRELSADPSLSFEEVLLGLRTSDNRQRRLMALAVPLFLQDLLLRTSADLSHHAFRYDALIDVLSDLPKVHYVTLNYDVLLDARLHQFRRLDAFADYVDDNEQWSLIKLHGSVNWAYVTKARFDPFQPPEELPIDRTDMRCFSPTHFDLPNMRGLGNPNACLYPAIALPEGPKDEIVAPNSHERYLRDSLSEAPQIDVLVLGYSALDTEVLALLADSATQIRRLTVVNRDPPSALGVWDVIANQDLNIVWPDVVDGSLAGWIDGSGLRDWVREYDTRPTTRIAPATIRSRIRRRDLGIDLPTEEELRPLPEQW